MTWRKSRIRGGNRADLNECISFTQHLLSACCMPGAILGIGDIGVSEVFPCFPAWIFLCHGCRIFFLSGLSWEGWPVQLVRSFSSSDQLAWRSSYLLMVGSARPQTEALTQSWQQNDIVSSMQCWPLPLLRSGFPPQLWCPTPFIPPLYSSL